MNNEIAPDDDSTIGTEPLSDAFETQDIERRSIRRRWSERRMFALPKKRKWRRPTKAAYQQFNADNYSDKYPKDPYSEEMGPNARVYRVFLDEATRINPEMVENWRENLDGILVFAGLFSAVVTTIVVEASRSLQPDYPKLTVLLLAQQLAMQQGEVIDSALKIANIDDFRPTTPDKWVNALWYTSLTFSLITALFAVLIKQWLQHFMTFVSGSPRDRARIIQSRRDALHLWRVQEIIGVLPVLLHFSLFVFFMGLILLLINLCFPIGVAVAAIVALCFTLYLLSTAAPLLYPRCPYITPLSSIIYTIIHFHKPNRNSLAGLERISVSKDSDTCDAQVLVWLQSAANFNPTVRDIIQQAVAGLRPGFSCISMLNDAGIVGVLNRGPNELPIQPNFSVHQAFFAYAKGTPTKDLEFYIRRSLQLFEFQSDTSNNESPTIFHTGTLVQAALLAFYPDLPHFHQIKSQKPLDSSYFHDWAVDVVQFLAAQAESAEPLRLHPIIWERLLVVSAKVLLLFAKGKDDLDGFIPFAQTITLSFLDRHSRDAPAVILGIASGNTEYADGVMPVDLLDIRLRDSIFYFVAVCFRLCNDPKHSISTVLATDTALVYGVLLQILRAPNAICLRDRTMALMMSMLRESVGYACEFVANDCHVVTREVAFLQAIPEEKRDIFRVERVAEYHNLLQQTAFVLHELISEDVFREEWLGYGGKELVSLYHFLDYQFPLLNTPLPLEVVVNREIIYSLLSNPTVGCTEKLISVSNLVSRWFEENRNDVLRHFTSIGGIYKIAEMFPIVDKSGDRRFHWKPALLTEIATCAVKLLIAFLRKVVDEGDWWVIAHCTEVPNIIYCVRVLFGVSILDTQYQEVPGLLSKLALKSAPSTRHAWCHALRLVIRDTPKNYTMPTFRKLYYTKAEELIRIVRARSDDAPGNRSRGGLTQYVYVRRGQLRHLPYSFQLQLGLDIHNRPWDEHVPIDFREIGHLLSNELELNDFIHLLAVADAPPERDPDDVSVMTWIASAHGDSPTASRSSSPDIGPLSPRPLPGPNYSDPSLFSLRILGAGPPSPWQGSEAEASMDTRTASSPALSCSIKDVESSHSSQADSQTSRSTFWMEQNVAELPSQTTSSNQMGTHQELRRLNTIYEGPGSGKSDQSGDSWTLSKILRLTRSESHHDSGSSEEDIIYSPSFSSRNAFVV